MQVVMEQQEAVNRCLNNCTQAVHSLTHDFEQVKENADALQQRVIYRRSFYLGSNHRRGGRSKCRVFCRRVAKCRKAELFKRARVI